MASWQDLPWDEISLRTEPVSFLTYTAHLVAPSQAAAGATTWPDGSREMEVVV
jgi:hypothetical protein